MSPAFLIGLLAAAAPAVAVTGECPSADAVTAALRSALGSDAKVGVSEIPKVSDLGDRFSVAAAGQVRQYVDPARDCDERARSVAVFIALALNPPLVPVPLPPRPPPQIAATPPPPAPAPSEHWLDLGAAARVDGGSAEASRASAGFELRVATGWRWIGVAATAGVLAPTEATLSSVIVRQQRFPLSLALAARHRISERFAIAGAAGGALVPLTLRASSIDGAQSSTRVDAGFRIAGELRFRATPRLAPFLGVHAEIFPRAYELDVDPVGPVGTTGRFWIGASVGLAFDVR